MDRGAWQATVHGGHKELDATEHIQTCILFSLLNSKGSDCVSYVVCPPSMVHNNALLMLAPHKMMLN